MNHKIKILSVFHLLFAFLVLLSNFVYGQNLPVVVDNSAFFPPVRSQQAIPNCTNFSLIYYLKSAIWNREFNRNPALEENQFSHTFVWNQMIDPVYEKTGTFSAFLFMEKQGCATVTDFPLNEQSSDVQPSILVRERALSYKSKRLFMGSFADCSEQTTLVNNRLKSLKDSLAQGKCFTLDVPLFYSFFRLSDKHNVYNVQLYNNDSIVTWHVFTIVGYNDTIKTSSGRGAFQVINSNKEIASGHLYYDYNWFYHSNQFPHGYYFLEEDFDSSPKLTMNLQLSGAVNSPDAYNGKFIFVDTLINYPGGKMDFGNFFTYLYSRNQAQIISVNNQRVNLRNNLIIFPFNSIDGDYNIVTDLTKLSSVKDFNSLSVLICDPVSANYVGDNNQIVYSYNREARMSVDYGYIHILGTNQRMSAKVIELPDTTMVFNNFSSFVLWSHANSIDKVFIKSCTSTIKRKLITFSISDLKEDTPPVWTKVQTGDLTVTKGTLASIQFEASDTENSPISYSITSGNGATINSSTGLFNYQTAESGEFIFTLKATDGVYTINTTFKVFVAELADEAPAFTTVPENGKMSFVHMSGNHFFEFKATDPEGKNLFFSLESGQYSSIDGSGLFNFVTSTVGTFPCVVKVSDGVNSVTTSFNVIVEPKPNNAPEFDGPQVSFLTYTNETLSYLYKAIDQDNDKLSFSLLNPLSEANVSSVGNLTFKSAKVGTYKFIVVVSDGKDSSELLVTVIVDNQVGTEDFAGPVIKIEGVPNPFSKSITLKLTLTQNETINLTIVDYQGREIACLTSGKYNPDVYQFVFETPDLPTGIYFARLKTSSGIKTIKLVKTNMTPFYFN